MPGNFDPKIDALSLGGNLPTNPCTRPNVTLYRDNYALAAIDQDELNLFKAQFAALMMMPGSDERKIMLDRLDIYVLALRAIKQALNSARFAGIYAEDTEIGMGFIRPQFIRTNSAYRANWNQNVAAAWADWFWETAGNAFAVGRDFGLAVTHLKSLAAPSPLMTECRFNVGRTQLLPLDLRNLQLADTENNITVAPIPSMILIPKAALYARAKSDVAGAEVMALGGLVFGLGRVLREEVPAWLP